MAPGDWGKITVTESKGKATAPFEASTYIRDDDGQRRRVRRTGISEEDARRNLQRHLKTRTTPVHGQKIDERSTLANLFDEWIATKQSDGLKPQSVEAYRQAWELHGKKRFGSLRPREVTTSGVDQYLRQLEMAKPSRARQIRVILTGMLALAARYDVVTVNKVRETKTVKSRRKPARALEVHEYQRVKDLVVAYATDTKAGPPRGRLLLPFIELLTATGARPNEVLALRWCDVDLLGNPATVTFTGTLIEPKASGEPLRRQDDRKHDAPAHVVVLPDFAVEALTNVFSSSALTDPASPVFANREGGWMALGNLRRNLRDALKGTGDLKWVTPYSFRRTVATVVRDEYGVEAAQHQLSHAKLATTEAHYVQRVTHAPDHSAALSRFNSGKVDVRK